MDLVTLFRSLSRPNVEAGTTAFCVAPIPGFEVHRIGKDSSGAPALLVNIAGRGGHLAGPVVLQHIAVQHGVRCRISSVGSTEFREEEAGK
jgi:hypothetical protein